MGNLPESRMIDLILYHSRAQDHLTAQASTAAIDRKRRELQSIDISVS